VAGDHVIVAAHVVVVHAAPSMAIEPIAAMVKDIVPVFFTESVMIVPPDVYVAEAVVIVAERLVDDEPNSPKE